MRNRERLFAVGLVLVAALSVAWPVWALAATASPAPVYTEIPIPGSPVETAATGYIHGKITSLPQYIGLVYNFILGAIGVVASVAIVIGGFQYLTAGGDKSKVDAGKKRITNALAGLVLAFTAYLLLNTINPDLVNLNPPTVQGISRIDLQYAATGGTLGTPCNKDSDCRAGMSCIVVKDPPIVKLSKYLTWGAVGTVALPVLGAANAGGVAAKVVTTAVRWVGKAFIVAPLTTAVGAGATVYKAADILGGYEGFCANKADHVIDQNGICTEDANCLNGMICLKDPGLAAASGIDTMGVCTSGANGQYCQCLNGGCFPGTCKTGFKCVQVGDKLGSTEVRVCSAGHQGDHCDNESSWNMCVDADNTCKMRGSVGTCGSTKGGGEGDPCKSDADCLNFDQPDNSASTSNPKFHCIKSPNNPSCLTGGNYTDQGCYCHVFIPTSAVAKGTYCYKKEDCNTGSLSSQMTCVYSSTNPYEKDDPNVWGVCWPSSQVAK